MAEHVGGGLAAVALIYANFFLGMPLVVLLWALGWMSEGHNVDGKFRSAKVLFTGSILFNAVWMVFQDVPYEWTHTTTVHWIEESAETPIMLVAFAILCASTFISYRSRGPGKTVLLSGQAVFILLSSICWILVLNNR